jgi:biopolymer transport protein ExbB
MNSTLTQNGLSFARYWAQGDAISHFVAYILLAMSLLCWYFILSKLWSSWRVRRSARALTHFWQAPQMSDAIAMLKETDLEQVFLPMAQHAVEAAQLSGSSAGAGAGSSTESGAGSIADSGKPAQRTMESGTDPSERITRRLRQDLTQVTLRLESGLTLLASIGATAPFVGLLGTVWGIYHALTVVSSSGTMQIDKLAGPVGEALIMTALGLVVAIPSVLAYNAFGRINRLTLAELDGFAHDLHSYLTTGHHRPPST